MGFTYDPLVFSGLVPAGSSGGGGGGDAHWKAPVANFAALPALGNNTGDVRVTLDTGDIWEWDGSAWIQPYANKALSNLTGTAINTGLVPGADASIDLGSNADRWANIHVINARDSGGVPQIDFTDRELVNSVGNPALVWSGATPSLANNQLADVADPINPQDAATKNYVDGLSRNVEVRTITSGEEAAKQLVLADAPITHNFTVLEIAGAPSQFYGDDFTVGSNILSWSGLGLDGILAAGDRVTIIYN